MKTKDFATAWFDKINIVMFCSIPQFPQDYKFHRICIENIYFH